MKHKDIIIEPGDLKPGDIIAIESRALGRVTDPVEFLRYEAGGDLHLSKVFYTDKSRANGEPVYAAADACFFYLVERPQPNGKIDANDDAAQEGAARVVRIINDMVTDKVTALIKNNAEAIKRIIYPLSAQPGPTGHVTKHPSGEALDTPPHDGCKCPLCELARDASDELAAAVESPAERAAQAALDMLEEHEGTARAVTVVLSERRHQREEGKADSAALMEWLAIIDHYHDEAALAWFKGRNALAKDAIRKLAAVALAAVENLNISPRS